jgi:hypothetical protein
MVLSWQKMRTRCWGVVERERVSASEGAVELGPEEAGSAWPMPQSRRICLKDDENV